jgi:hypothetical protein
MDVEAVDVFTEIAKYEAEGLMFHDGMADYFDYLNLMGFKRLHEYRFLAEAVEMRGVHRYFINHFGLPLNGFTPEKKQVIPSVWRGFERDAIEQSAKRSAVAENFEEWVRWEKKGKRLMEESYQQLCNLNEVAAACKVRELVHDADMELKCAQRMHIRLKTIDYDMVAIDMMQDELHEQYRKKEESLGVDIC